MGEGTGPATATVLDGDNAWYTKMIFSGLSRAVSAASIMIEGQSEPIQMNRNGGATWSASTPEAHSGNVDVTFTLTLDNEDTVELADCFTSWPQSTSASCTATSADTGSSNCAAKWQQCAGNGFQDVCCEEGTQCSRTVNGTRSVVRIVRRAGRAISVGIFAVENDSV